MRTAALCLAALAFLWGCAARRAPEPGAIPPEEISRNVRALDAARFQARATELQARTNAMGKSSGAAPDETVLVRLELAYINLDYRNPSRNYSLALRELEAVLAHVPPGSTVRYEIENLVAALRTIQSLRERLDREREEVERLREGLERLQDVEIEIERKRREIK